MERTVKATGGFVRSTLGATHTFVEEITDHGLPLLLIVGIIVFLAGGLEDFGGDQQKATEVQRGGLITIAVAASLLTASKVVDAFMSPLRGMEWFWFLASLALILTVAVLASDLAAKLAPSANGGGGQMKVYNCASTHGKEGDVAAHTEEILEHKSYAAAESDAAAIANAEHSGLSAIAQDAAQATAAPSNPTEACDSLPGSHMPGQAAHASALMADQLADQQALFPPLHACQ